MAGAMEGQDRCNRPGNSEGGKAGRTGENSLQFVKKVSVNGHTYKEVARNDGQRQRKYHLIWDL